MTRGVVIDASALLAWLLGEAGDVIAAVDEALDARGDAPVQCPALLVAEIANGLRMALRRGRMSLAQAVQAASIVDELGLAFDRGDAKVASRQIRMG